jgi:hypothetical protein
MSCGIFLSLACYLTLSVARYQWPLHARSFEFSYLGNFLKCSGRPYTRFLDTKFVWVLSKDTASE